MNTFEQTFGVGESCTVEVDTTSGDVRVVGEDVEHVSVHSSDGEAAVSRQDEALKITPAMGGSTDVLVTVPRLCLAKVHAISGDVHLSNLEGEINVQTMSGDVHAENVSGDIVVHTVSGDIHIQGPTLTSVQLESVSGDATVQARLQGEGAFQLHSVSGDLHLLVPADQACTLHSQSLSGSIKCGLPHEVRQLGWGKQEAVINGGGARVSVRTTSGDVRIQAVESRERADAREKTRPRHETVPLNVAEPSDEPFGLDDMPLAEGQESLGGGGTASQRMQILKAIEDGTLSVSEGLERLGALE